MYRVRYTENALQDLEDVFSYIAMDNLERALSFALELKEHWEEVLSVFPMAEPFTTQKKVLESIPTKDIPRSIMCLMKKRLRYCM